VAQEFLYRANVSASFEKVSRKAMPNGVWADPWDSSLPTELSNDEAQGAAIHRTIWPVAEEINLLFSKKCP